jgi:hypothetical protein
MQESSFIAVVWRKVLLPAIVLALFFLAIRYLVTVYQDQGTERFLYSLVLVCALFIGIAHIILFVFRKSYESKNSTDYKRKKRHLEKWRNIVNYITPFVLIAMLYHFWMKGWVLAVVIVSVLLFDRVNELRRRNK